MSDEIDDETYERIWREGQEAMLKFLETCPYASGSAEQSIWIDGAYDI